MVGKNEKYIFRSIFEHVYLLYHQTYTLQIENLYSRDLD